MENQRKNREMKKWELTQIEYGTEVEVEKEFLKENGTEVSVK